MRNECGNPLEAAPKKGGPGIAENTSAHAKKKRVRARSHAVLHMINIEANQKRKRDSPGVW
jgi:hypothetical protein